MTGKPIVLVCLDGAIIQVLLGKSGKRFLVSHVANGELVKTICESWEAVCNELDKLNSEHGLYVEQNPSIITASVFTKEQEASHTIYSRHVTILKKPKSDLKKPDLVKKYCKSYTQEYGIKLKTLDVWNELQKLLK